MAVNVRNAAPVIASVLIPPLTFMHFVPKAADIRTAEPFNRDIEKGERQALWTSIAGVTLVSWLFHSADAFIAGGALTIFYDFGTKHANAVSPHSGNVSGHVPAGMDMGNNESFPMPSYSSEEA